MKVATSTFFVASALGLLLSFSCSVYACTCVEISPCEAYASASVVFVGLVTKTGVSAARGQMPANAMSTTLTNSSPVAQLKIEEAFRGIESAEVEISGGGTTCDYHFKQGERYLVFADKNSNDNSLSTTICSGTSLLAEAGDGLAYLRSATSRAAGGTVFGDISREPDRIGENGGEFEPIPKAEVIFENGNQKFQTVSDLHGKFELAGLPPGRYKVRTNPPTNFSRADVMSESPRGEWELDVPEHGCIQTWFTARQAGEISGTVGDISGIVAEDVEPVLVPVDAVGDKSQLRSVRLGDFRTFKFSFLPPGRYYLGFNLGSGPDLMEPYPEFYYPGVEERSKATIITLSKDQKVSELYLPRPLRLAERMIEGVAQWPDGRPYLTNCGIQLINPRTGYREGNCVSTDAQGHFKIKAIEGQTYELSTTMTTGKSVGLVNSKPVIVKVEKENRPVKLVVEAP